MFHNHPNQLETDFRMEQICHPSIESNDVHRRTVCETIFKARHQSKSPLLWLLFLTSGFHYIQLLSVGAHTFSQGIFSDLFFLSPDFELAFSELFGVPCLFQLWMGNIQLAPVICLISHVHTQKYVDERQGSTQLQKENTFSPFLLQQSPSSKPPLSPGQFFSHSSIWYHYK